MAMVPASGAKDVALSVNSLLASAASSAARAATRMLMSVAAPPRVAAAPGEACSWWAVDCARHVLMFVIWGNVWLLRFLTDTFAPPRTALSLTFDVDMLAAPRGSSPSSALVALRGPLGGSAVSSTAMGRALTHTLGVLNEIPAGSRKYEYVLAMADRLVLDNIHSGDAALLDVNRAALAAAFTRTCDLLRRALQHPSHPCFSSSAPTWASRVVGLLPPGPRQIYDGVRACLSSLFPPTDTAALRAYKPQRHAGIAAAAVTGSYEWLEAEKLAHELLWITNKLRLSCAGYEAVARWAFASGLAPLALVAHPRVQAPIVKNTVVLIRELEGNEWEVAREVRFGLLALWLPVLCYAGSGAASSHAVDGAERWETERALEELVGGLPADDQEVILRNWLEDFAASDSDWPNLRRCFDRWCRSSRKQLLLS